VWRQARRLAHPPTTATTRRSRPSSSAARDAACESLAPRLTDCAIADARATMSPDELAKLDLEKTAPVHTQKFLESCKAQTLSSRQVRVYEVCQREESDCEPLIACLDNASPQRP
jgi:hypothetical protein